MYRPRQGYYVRAEPQLTQEFLDALNTIASSKIELPANILPPEVERRLKISLNKRLTTLGERLNRLLTQSEVSHATTVLMSKVVFVEKRERPWY